ncbi:uncharacterized protein LOC131530619 isoform X1 [Onychostoma macrolepis]|uniref:uncharacterized protein LOC131530619 isoform X1 n=1 Tax=Onychostoma macrolepis TaxID=369639 RepID=UPI002729BB3D|nr:uncharacterized protein LOC131530619 isoform X1 [Onychostoma macrolepis]
MSMRNLSFICWVLLLVDVSPSGHVKTNDEYNMARIEQYSGKNVFVAVADGVKTVIVMEGDSLTLNTNVTEIKRDVTVLWMFGDDNSIIANMNEAAGIFSDNDNERFRDRLELDKQTGSLTIRNIRTEHTGLYQLKIKSTTETSKKFSVTVRDDVQSVSLLEGDSVTLQTGVTKIQRDDRILWKFGDQGTLIADLNGTTDAKWKNMIKLNDHTGDLTIRNIQTEHSGDYDLEINNSSMILHRKIHIAVSELPPSSHWQTTGPVLAVIVGILIVIVIVISIGFKNGWFKVCWPCKKSGETY